MLNEAKITEINLLIVDLWDGVLTCGDISRIICDGYISGLYSRNEHYQISDIYDLVVTYQASLVEEPI